MIGAPSGSEYTESVRVPRGRHWRHSPILIVIVRQKCVMEIENLRRISEESKRCSEQDAREASARAAEEAAAQARQREADLPQRIAEVENKVR